MTTGSIPGPELLELQSVETESPTFDSAFFDRLATMTTFLGEANAMGDFSAEIGVSLDEIDPHLWPASQMRAGLDKEAVAEYATMIDDLPPVKLIIEAGSKRQMVVDGAHTITAAREAGRMTIMAQVKNGTRLDAWREAARCNEKRGVRITDGDKRHRVEAFLGLPEAKKMTQRQIAEACNVAQSYVARIKVNFDHSGQSNRLSDPHGLTPAERKVADAYAADPDLSVEAAARTAGVSKRTAIKARGKIGMSSSRGGDGPPASDRASQPASEDRPDREKAAGRDGKVRKAPAARRPAAPPAQEEQDGDGDGGDDAWPGPDPLDARPIEAALDAQLAACPEGVRFDWLIHCQQWLERTFRERGITTQADRSFFPPGYFHVDRAWRHVEEPVAGEFDAWPEDARAAFMDRLYGLFHALARRVPAYQKPTGEGPLDGPEDPEP
jgi:hypothetical protein